MERRGHTLHVLSGNAAGALEALGYRVAICGYNDRWTSFVPFDATAFDGEAASKALMQPVLHVWFNDEIGVVAQAFTNGEFAAEIALTGDSSEITTSDVEAVDTLVQLGILSASNKHALVQMLTSETFNASVRDHRFEELLDLPFYSPIPTNASEAILRDLLPNNAEIVEPTEQALAAYA